MLPRAGWGWEKSIWRNKVAGIEAKWDSIEQSFPQNSGVTLAQRQGREAKSDSKQVQPT